MHGHSVLAETVHHLRFLLVFFRIQTPTQGDVARKIWGLDFEGDKNFGRIFGIFIRGLDPEISQNTPMPHKMSLFLL